MLASSLGLDLDPEVAWNERRRIYEHSHLVIESLSMTAATEGDIQGRWTCAVAAAVFLFS
jgi:arginine decarboxylase